MASLCCTRVGYAGRAAVRPRDFAGLFATAIRPSPPLPAPIGPDAAIRLDVVEDPAFPAQPRLELRLVFHERFDGGEPSLHYRSIG